MLFFTAIILVYLLTTKWHNLLYTKYIQTRFMVSIYILICHHLHSRLCSNFFVSLVCFLLLPLVPVGTHCTLTVCLPLCISVANTFFDVAYLLFFLFFLLLFYMLLLLLLLFLLLDHKFLLLCCLFVELIVLVLLCFLKLVLLCFLKFQ